jgi:hypothetical protein
MGPLSVGDVFSDTISDICPGQCDQGIYLERRARRLVKRAQGPVSHIHLHPKRAMLRSVWKGKASVPGTSRTWLQSRSRSEARR